MATLLHVLTVLPRARSSRQPTASRSSSGEQSECSPTGVELQRLDACCQFEKISALPDVVSPNESYCLFVGSLAPMYLRVFVATWILAPQAVIGSLLPTVAGRPCTFEEI